MIADWTASLFLGIVHRLNINTMFDTLLAIILMDGWMYLWHRASHRIPFLMAIPSHAPQRPPDGRNDGLKVSYRRTCVFIPVKVCSRPFTGYEPLAVNLLQNHLITDYPVPSQQRQFTVETKIA